MTEMTLLSLVAVIRECAGDSDDFDLEGDILDIPFDELGYDSLALIEIVARLKREYGAVISEELIIEMKTPRIALRIINDSLVKKVS